MLIIPVATSCRFCSIVTGPSAAGVDTPWLEDDHYLAIASVGALVPGWSLVVPKGHAYNLLGDLQDTAFYDFLSNAVKRVESRYGPAVLFEHGGVSADSATSCGTAHAHLHIVPLSFDLAAAVAAEDPSLIWESVELTDLANVVGESEYLFFANRYRGRDTSGFVAKLATGRSQFFRKVIAAQIGCPTEYDYKVFPRLDVAMQTARSLAHDVSSISRVA